MSVCELDAVIHSGLVTSSKATNISVDEQQPTPNLSPCEEECFCRTMTTELG